MFLCFGTIVISKKEGARRIFVNIDWPYLVTLEMKRKCYVGIISSFCEVMHDNLYKTLIAIAAYTLG